MPKPRLLLAISLVLAFTACDNKPTASSSTSATASSRIVPPLTSVFASANGSTTTASTTSSADQGVTLGHIRVAVRKVSVGRVPLKDADGTIRYTEEPRLMVALRIENLSDNKQSKYSTWVPDLDMAKTVAKLTDDHGTELKRVTLGFGNNVKDRTVTDDLTPGKVISDLLVFEVPPAGALSFRLELPGANCGVKDSFVFQFDAASLKR